MDMDALQNLVTHLQQKSKTFSSAAKTIMDTAQGLDNIASDLATDPQSWAGNGAKGFEQAWIRYHGNALSSALNLDATSRILSKFASDLQSQIDKINQEQAEIEGMTTLTVALGIADILQLGLDPVTDTATGASGGGDAALMSELSSDEAAISEMDATLATEIESVTAEIESVSSLDQLELDIPAAQTAEFTTLDDEMLDEELLDENDPDAFFSKKGNGPYKNPTNLSPDSTNANMPPGIKNPEGSYWIQKLKDLGIRVEWNLQAQTQLEMDNAYGGTYNYNGETGSDPNLVVVALSPDATPAVVEEEYLHALEAQSRGWSTYATGDQMGPLTEEIKVEYQVLQDAQANGMTSAEFNDLAAGRADYIQKLQALYQKAGLSWPPPDLAPYLQTPPKPPGLP